MIMTIIVIAILIVIVVAQVVGFRDLAGLREAGDEFCVLAQRLGEKKLRGGKSGRSPTEKKRWEFL